MLRGWLASIVLLLALMPSGCGTLLDLGRGRERGQRIYGGLRYSIDPPSFSPYLLISWLDLPFSAAVDTVVLPITLLVEVARWQEEAAEAERIRRRDGSPE